MSGRVACSRSSFSPRTHSHGSICTATSCIAARKRKPIISNTIPGTLPSPARRYSSQHSSLLSRRRRGCPTRQAMLALRSGHGDARDVWCHGSRTGSRIPAVAAFNSLLRNEYNQADVDSDCRCHSAVTLRGRLPICLGRRTKCTDATGRASGLRDGKSAAACGQGGIHVSTKHASPSARMRSGCKRQCLFPNEPERLPACVSEGDTGDQYVDVTADSNFSTTRIQRPVSNMTSCIGVGSLIRPGRPPLESALIQGGYSRDTLRSDTTYIAPQSFERERSFYRDNAHRVDGRVDLVLPQYAGLTTAPLIRRRILSSDPEAARPSTISHWEEHSPNQVGRVDIGMALSRVW